MKNKNRGISLIVLVLTIIIIIILAGVVILNVTKNNPIESAKKAKFLSDLDTFKTELELYIGKKQTDTLGDYDRNELNATKDKVSENGIESTDKNIGDIIPGMKDTKYEDKFQVEDGKLVYVGKDKDEINWSTENGVEVTAVKIEVSALADVVSISGRIKVTGSLVEVEKIEKYEIYVAKKNEEYPSSPSKEITDKNVEVEYNVDGLSTGQTYKIKVVLVMDGVRYQKEISDIVTINDDTPPNVEEIEVTIVPNTWTNKNVTVTINNIPEDAVKIQYTLPNSAEWIEYKGAFEVGKNGVVNIRVEDIAGNEAVKTVLIDKIDKISPKVSLDKNEIQDVKDVTVRVSATDSESGIKSIKYQWSESKEQIQDIDESWNKADNIENNSTVNISGITNTLYLQVLAEDNAGNKNVFVSSSYVIDNTPPNANQITATMSPSIWTNSDVTVTLGNIPEDATIKQYTLPGSSTWNNYTGAFVVSQNGTINIRVEDGSRK